MKGRQFTPEKIIGLLRQAEVELAQGKRVGEVCRGLGISEQSYYRWRTKYGGLKLEQARRMKDLEKENGRLRKAVAQLTFDKQILNRHSRETSKPRTPTPMRGASAAGTRDLGAARLPNHRPATFDPAQSASGAE
jgi:transposase-like protein